MASGKRGALARIGSGIPAVGDLISVVRELSFEELREEAMQPPRLLLLGNERGLTEALREGLAGGGGNLIETALIDDMPGFLDSYDGIVLVNLSQADRNRTAIRQLLQSVETAGRTLTFQLPPSLGQEGGMPIPEAAIEELRGRIVTRLSHRQLALGRYLPSFRRQVVTSVINQTSRANAEFALLSNLPAMIPLVGNLMAVGADFLVLTKNQLMLIYKLAAIHGRDLHQPQRIFAEMLPVVGAGIVWRTAARELAALIPFAAGTIPKVLIAYAGTAVTGQAANFYYLNDERPSREQLGQFYARAVDLARALPIPWRGGPGRGKVIEGQFTEQRPADPATATAEEGPQAAPPPIPTAAAGTEARS